MEDTKPLLTYGVGTPYVSIHSNKGNPIIDFDTKLPIGTFITDFWYEYNEDESDECEFTIECGNPDIISIPELSIQSSLIIQWGWIYPQGESYNGPIRRVLIRDYSLDFSESGVKVSIKCTDLPAVLKHKVSDYASKYFGTWFENNIKGKFAFGITDYEVDSNLVLATPWNQPTLGNSKVQTELQKPTVTPKSEPKGKELFTESDSQSIHEKLLEDRDKYYVGDNKIVNYRMVYGTDRTIYGQLKNLIKGIPGNFSLDTRDDKISIHTPNYNQKPILTYTYMGGNGELLQVSIRTEKKEKKDNLSKSSTINPKTKEVNNSIQQSFVDTTNVPEYLRRPEEIVTSVMNSGRKSFSLPNYDNSKVKEKLQKKNQAKDYKTTQEELNNNYQLSQEEVVDAMKYFREDYQKKVDAFRSDPNAKNAYDLMRANSLGKYLVPVKKFVKYTVDPLVYGETGDLKQAIVGEKPKEVKGEGLFNQVRATNSTFNNNNGVNNVYGKGDLALKNDPSIIVVGEKASGRSLGREEDFYNYDYPYLEVVVETQMYVEMDGARVAAAATPQSLQEVRNSNYLNGSSQKQVVSSLKVIGRPELTSGKIIELNNISTKYSGKWYVKKARHQINSSGYLVNAELILKGVPKMLSTSTSKSSPIKGMSNWKKIHEYAKKAIEGGYTPQDALSDYIYNVQVKAGLDENFAKKTSLIQVNAEDLQKNKDASKIVKSDRDAVDINKQRDKERSNIK